MTPVISPDIIARIKDETDIVETVRRYVDLKPAGGVFKGLCPFHKEKTPSFIVTPGRNTYHCFGCAVGGDVLSFVMESEGLSFPEAVELLARPLDIDLSEWLREEEGEGEKRSFHRANETAQDIWKESFWDERSGARALAYLNKRGFGDKVLRDFDVGWAPASSTWLASELAGRGVDKDLALRSDLLRTKDGGSPFAYFRSRIIFPIKNISRQVTGFGGRVIDQGEPKYLNSADSPFFSKGKLLYGFEASRLSIAREKTAILVEGYLDVLALAQGGFPNSVATCGTAFTPDQARLIKRSVGDVYLVFDGDKAGLKAAVRSADVALKTGLEPKIVRLPQGEDPASLTIDKGVEAMQETLSAAVGYVPFLKALADEKGGDRELSERALRQALGTVAGIEDALRREYVLQETADVFGMQIGLLRDSVEQEMEKKNRRFKPKPAGGGRKTMAAAGKQNAPDGPDGYSEESGPDPRDDETSATKRFRRGMRPLGRVRPSRIEPDLFFCVLNDGTGAAAQYFLKNHQGQEFTPVGMILTQELEQWSERCVGGHQQDPMAFIQERWNTAGDAEYRNFVSQLVNREDRPAPKDFITVIDDCLTRLRRSY